MSNLNNRKNRSRKSKSRSPRSSRKHQCMYINKNDVQCKRIEAVKGVWFCNIHLNNIFNLKIKKSGIKGAGYGLFSGSEGFKKDDIVGEYSRYDIKKSSKKAFNKCYSHKCTEYIYCDEGDSCWDAKNTPSLLTRYANDARNDKKNNTSFENIGRRAFMVAYKNIKPNSEIFCDYSDSYDWSFLDKD